MSTRRIGLVPPTPAPVVSTRETRELLTQRDLAQRVKQNPATLRRIPFFRRTALPTGTRTVDKRWPDWVVGEYARLLEIGSADALPIKRVRRAS
jgi:hypothetical protein